SLGVSSTPDFNFRRCARETFSFTFDPPTSMTRILFFTASPISSLRSRRFRPRRQSAPAGPHALFLSNHQAFSCVRVILREIATAPGGAVLRLQVLNAGTCRPAATPAPSRDRSERLESR